MGKKEKLDLSGFDAPEETTNKSIDISSFDTEEVIKPKKASPAPQIKPPTGGGVSNLAGGISESVPTTSDYLTFQQGTGNQNNVVAPLAPVSKPVTPKQPQQPIKKQVKQPELGKEMEAFLPDKKTEFTNLRVPTEEEYAKIEQERVKKGETAINEVGGKKIISPTKQYEVKEKKKEEIKKTELYDPQGRISPLGSRMVSAQDPFNVDREKELKKAIDSFDSFKINLGGQKLDEDTESKNFYLYYLQQNEPDEFKYQSERLDYNKDNPLERQKIEFELINKGIQLKQKALSAKSEQLNNLLSDDFYGYKNEITEFKQVNSDINALIPKIESLNNELSKYNKDENGNLIIDEVNRRKVEKLIDDYKNEYGNYESLIKRRDEMLGSGFGQIIKKADEIDQEQRKNYEYAKNLEKTIKESDKYPELKKELINEAFKKDLENKAWSYVPEWGKATIDFTNGFRRAGTELLKGLAFLPKLAGEKSGYGWTDKFADFSDEAISGFERYAMPVSANSKKDIFDYERNPDGSPKLDANGNKIEKTNYSAIPYQLGNGVGNLAIFMLSGGAGTALEGVNVLSKVGLTGNALSKVGTFAAGYTMAAKNNYDEAKANGMSETDALKYSQYKSIVDGGIELIFPEQKLITPSTRKASMKLAAKYLSKGVPLKDAIVKSSTETLKNIVGENVEELSAELADYLSKSVAEKATGTDFKIDDGLMNKVKSTVLVTSIITAPFGIVGSKGRKNQMESQSLFLAANKPNEMLSDIDDLLEAKVIDQKQAEIARERIKVASEQLKTIPEDLSDDKKASVLPQLVDKAILENKKKETNPAFHANIDNQIKEKDAEIEKEVNRPDNGLTTEQNDELEDLAFKKENGVITEQEQKKLDELNKFSEEYKNPKAKTRTMVTVEVLPEGQRFPQVTTIAKEEFQTFKQNNPSANIVSEREVAVEEKPVEEKITEETKKEEVTPIAEQKVADEKINKDIVDLTNQIATLEQQKKDALSKVKKETPTTQPKANLQSVDKEFIVEGIGADEGGGYENFTEARVGDLRGEASNAEQTFTSSDGKTLTGKIIETTTKDNSKKAFTLLVNQTEDIGYLVDHVKRPAYFSVSLSMPKDSDVSIDDVSQSLVDKATEISKNSKKLNPGLRGISKEAFRNVNRDFSVSGEKIESTIPVSDIESEYDNKIKAAQDKLSELKSKQELETKKQENAIQKPITNEGVLRQEGPKVELQGMGEGKPIVQVSAEEGKVEQPQIKQEEQVIEKPKELPKDDAGRTVGNKNYIKKEQPVGRTVTKTSPDGTKIKGTYKIVSANDLVPSHNPKTFSKNENFPQNKEGKTINDRDYEADKPAQSQVIDIAQTIDERAIDQTPIVSKEGIVYDGNNRTMSRQLAAENKTDKQYIEDLNDKAEMYGFTKEQIASVENPTLVFEVEQNLPFNTETMAKFNKTEKKAQSPIQRAVAISKSISDRARRKIANLYEQAETPSDVTSNPKMMKEAVDILVSEGLIQSVELPRFYDKGVATPDGVSLLEGIVLASALDEDAIRAIGVEGMGDVRKMIIKNTVGLIQNATKGENSLTAEIKGGIDIIQKAKAAKISVSDFLSQTSAFEEKQYTLGEMMMALLFETKTPAKLKTFLSNYNQDVGVENLMGEDTSKQALLERGLQNLTTNYEKIAKNLQLIAGGGAEKVGTGVKEPRAELTEKQAEKPTEKVTEAEKPKKEIVVSEAVSEIYDSVPELSDIGTKKEYAEYLDNIFPDSKYREPLYRGVPGEGKVARPGAANMGKGSYFAATKEKAGRYAYNGGRVFAAMINAKNPLFVSLNINEVRAGFIRPEKISVKEATTNEQNPEGRDSAASYDRIDRDDYVKYNQYTGHYVGKLDENGLPGMHEETRVTPKLEEVVLQSNNQYHELGNKKDIDGFKKFVEEKRKTEEKTTEKVNETEKTKKQKAEEINKKIDDFVSNLKGKISDGNTKNRLYSAPVVTPEMINNLIDLSAAVIKKSISGGATIAQAVENGINAIRNHPRYKRLVEAGQINEDNFENQIRDSWDGLIKDEEALAQEETKKKEEEAKKEVPPAKPPVTTEAEKGPAPEGKKERATATRILENKKFHEDVVKRLSNEAIFYEPTSVKKSEEFVNAVIDEYEANGRLDDLVNEYMADKSDVIPDNQKLLFGDLLTKKLEDIATKEQNEFVRETLFDKAEQVFEKTAKNTTTAAQQLALIRNRDTRMFSNEIYMRRYAKKQFSEMQDNAMSEAQKNDIKSAQEIIDEYRKSNEFAKEVEQATAEELKKIAETREGAGKVKQFNDIIDSLKVNLSDC